MESPRPRLVHSQSPCLEPRGGEGEKTAGPSPSDLSSSLGLDGVTKVVLTPQKPVPAKWFGRPDGNLGGLRILALASGGGQQGPILSAAGADVTVFDASDGQLAQIASSQSARGCRSAPCRAI